MSAKLAVAISTCPNDTFAFHGLLTGAVDAHGLELDFRLGDVQELNELLLAGEVDVAKGSFHAALGAGGGLDVLDAGAAVGRGVGPIVLRSTRARAARARGRVLCPGRWTTAALLWELFHRGEGRVDHVVFSKILPALARGDAELGVCIHEARFTWQDQGLELVEDLGERWERETGAPLPLGGLLVRSALTDDVAARLAAAVRASIDHGHAHPEEALVTMRAHAREDSDEVLWAHVELYVSEDTRSLGPEARLALRELHRAALTAGLVAEDARSLRVRG
jgi:1,4-dihydroxy-6-naphthoate synthase